MDDTFRYEQKAGHSENGATGSDGSPLPVWHPGPPEGEVVQVQRLGLLVRPASNAEHKLDALGGDAGWLVSQFAEFDGLPARYLIGDPSGPLDCTIRIPKTGYENESQGATVVYGTLGVTPDGVLALDVDDWHQDEEGYFVDEGAPLAIVYTTVELLAGDIVLAGFPLIALREQAKSQPILTSARLLAEHMSSEARKAALTRLRPYTVVDEWAECADCGARKSLPYQTGCTCGKGTRWPIHRVRIRVTGEGASTLYRENDSVSLRMRQRPVVEVGATVEGSTGNQFVLSVRSSVPLQQTGIVIPIARLEVFQAQAIVCRELAEGAPRTGLLAALLEDARWRGQVETIQGADLSPDLNPEQALAVRKILAMRPGQIYLVQGPPGTGKTTSIVEAIRKILSQPNASVLLSSHSNDAVDTGQKRLLPYGHVHQVRLAQRQRVPEFLREMVGKEFLPNANLIAGTCNRLAIDPDARTRIYDWLILDEANKVRIGEALALMALARRWVLIGDVKQLPPILEEDALSFKVKDPIDRVVQSESFYGWFWDQVASDARIMLRRQYRMRVPIGRLVSALFYNGELIHEASHARLDLSWPFDREVVWVDTGAQNEYRDAQKSMANQFEVAICKDIVSIIKKRVPDAEPALISMYSSQVRSLRMALKGMVPAHDIESVDAFEGRESDAVILSLVRSNAAARVGFLNNSPRVNVAISRAKRLLVVVGDSSTIVTGAPHLFGPIHEAARQTDRIVGIGAVVSACSKLRLRSETVALAKRALNLRRLK